MVTKAFPRICTIILLFSGCKAGEESNLDLHFRLEPASVDFGVVNVGSSSADRVRIRNLTEAPLSFTIEPANDSPSFDLLPRALDVPAETGLEVEVEFEPNGVGPFLGGFTVRPDSSVPPQLLELHGEGGSEGRCELDIDEDLLLFGTVVVGSTKTLTLAVRNECGRDVTVAVKNFSNTKLCAAGDEPSSFCLRLRSHRVGSDGSFLLATDETVTVEVNLTPTIGGVRELGQFSLSTCSEESCDRTIRFEGVSSFAGIECTPPSMDFGTIPIDTCSTRTFVCTNTTNERQTIDGWAMVPSDGPFTVEGSRPVALEPKTGRVEIAVEYCPTGTMPDRAELSIVADDLDPNRTITRVLAGVGCGAALTMTPDLLDFGSVSTLAPARRSLTVTNTADAPIDIAAFEVDTAQTGVFSQFSAGGPRIEPGESIRLRVAAQPVVAGRVHSGVVVRSTDSCAPDQPIKLVAEGVVMPPCEYTVTPTTLSFGDVAVGRTVTRGLEVHNSGSVDCLLTGADFRLGSDPAFRVTEEIRSVVVGPGATEVVSVDFSPTQNGAFSGELEVGLSSPSAPTATVVVRGNGASSGLLIVPQTIDFGVLSSRCSSFPRTVTVFNTGTVPATLDALSMVPADHPAFAFVVPPVVPVSIAPGDRLEIRVVFRAPEAHSYAAAIELNLTVGGSSERLIVGLLGRGGLPGIPVKDHFTVNVTPQADVLFVVDRGIGMAEEQASLAAGFAAFEQAMNANRIDYRVAVTTAATTPEFGRFVHPTGPDALFSGPVANRIITAATIPAPGDVFRTNVTVGTARPGNTTDHAGLEAARLALSTPNIVGHNAHFLRQPASLAIVFVANVDDASPSTIDFYRSFFLNIKGFRNGAQFTASAVVGPSPGGCTGSNGTGVAAARYLEMASRTGGVTASICSPNWASVFAGLASSIAFNPIFVLSNQPLISTIEVRIDGVLVPTTAPGGTVNWTYDFASNSIRLSAFAPVLPGSNVDVEYRAECR